MHCWSVPSIRAPRTFTSGLVTSFTRVSTAIWSLSILRCSARTIPAPSQLAFESHDGDVSHALVLGSATSAPMGDHPDSAMLAMKQHAETHLSARNEHLVALDTELNASTPDAKKVSAHITQILKECAGMSTMPGKAMPGKAMPKQTR